MYVLTTRGREIVDDYIRNCAAKRKEILDAGKDTADAGGMAAAFAVVSALKYRRFALAQFGGVTGDTSGFFLQLCELCGLIGVWIGGLL